MADMIKEGSYVRIKKDLLGIDSHIKKKLVRTPGIVPEMIKLEGQVVKIYSVFKNNDRPPIALHLKEPDYHYCIENHGYTYIEEYFEKVTDENNNLLFSFD